ncbi:hypothetical protein J6590_006982 [Homalodisca vitripennis]|nr:hypothetical protein J6590_006982 [Homalodisca vitripennis]
MQVSGDQMVTADLVILEDFSVSGSVDTLGHVNHIDLRDVVTLNTDQTLHGSYKFECVEAMQNLSATGKVSGLNMSEWKEMAVVQDKQQEMTGVWRIKRHLDLKGSVTGPGRLGDVDLQELTDNITRNIIDVHEEMKENLSTVCEDTNRHLNKARNQTSELLYVDVTQEITMRNVVSLVKYFKVCIQD